MKNKTLEEMIDEVAKKMADRFATQFKNEIYKEMEKLQGRKTSSLIPVSSGCGSSTSSCGGSSRVTYVGTAGCGSSTTYRSSC